MTAIRRMILLAAALAVDLGAAEARQDEGGLALQKLGHEHIVYLIQGRVLRTEPRPKEAILLLN